MNELDRYAVSLENMEVLRAQVEALEAWKAEELALMNPIMDYARSVCTGPFGCSITEWLVSDHKAQAREIERLKQGQDILILARDEQKRLANEYRDLWSRAALSAPSHGEQVRVLGHDGWRQAVDNVSAYAHLYNSGFGIIHEIRAEYARLLAAAPSAGSQKEQE